MIPKIESRDPPPEGYLWNAVGHLVPASALRPQQKLEDEMVQRLVQMALDQAAALETLKGVAFEDVRGFLELLAQEYQVQRGGRRGNVTFTTFDGLMKVSVSVSDFISFGPELQVAKALIDECLTSWSASAGDELRTIVTDAFRVNKEGKLDVDAILGLRRYNFEDERWQRAMAAINDAIRVTHSKEYIRFHLRPSPDREFVQIPLDIARV